MGRKNRKIIQKIKLTNNIILKLNQRSSKIMNSIEENEEYAFKHWATVIGEEAVERLEPYNCVIMRDFSMSAVEAFSDGELDFVYIDGNHDFKNVACDVVEWDKVVRSGGIVAGHDFRRSKGKKYILNVKDVVQAFAYAHKISPWFVLCGDRIPNWMWVKE